ncbi:MAG: hypothetical protein FJ125_07255, partial [Deltaproteobacteria bacterium]|nr:hypothetical protein [Deltaproteobacteria bacterium]
MHRVLAALGRCWRRACPDEAAGDRLLALLVGLAAVLALLPGLDGELVVDDHPIIEKGTVVRSGDPLLALRSAYWDGTKVHNRTVYRPLTILSLLAGWQLWGDNAPAFRATGIVLHALVAVLLFALLRCATARQLGVGRGAAAWAALLFAVHPIHVEAVLSAVNRSE